MSQLVKKEARQRIVWAEVYAPNRPDSDNEFMDEVGIREMAYKFMKAGRLNQIDSGHTNQLVEGAVVVESFIARKGDPDFIEGSWVVGVHIPRDEDWAKVENGEWNGFSMEALVQKEPIAVSVDLPPVLSGKTLKSSDEDHVHTFYVTYDEEGRFLGGRTDIVEGHSHSILKGAVTEKAQGHSHRFSHFDDLVLEY